MHKNPIVHKNPVTSKPSAASAAAPNQRRHPMDGWLFGVVVALVIFGLVMVYDASYCIARAYDDYNHDPFYFARKQVISAALGFGGLFLFSRIPHWKFKTLAVPSFIVSILLLMAVWGMGMVSLGARRWIGFGPIQIQPSEVAKLALVLFLAWLISVNRSYVQSARGVFWLTIAVGIPMVLTERQPDLGTAATMFFTYLILLAAAGVPGRYLATILAVSTLLAGITLTIPSKKHGNEGGANYRLRRITTFLNPEADKEKDGYQVWRSLVALGSGGATGSGFTKSHEKRPGGMPAQRTDFIFAVIGEEFGLVGTSAVLAGFFFLTWRGIKIALQTKDPFGRFLAIGLTSMVAVQALLNIAVVTSCAPTTGIPLPLISYGGSSLVPTLCGLGLLLGISCHPDYKEPAKTTNEPNRKRTRT